MSDLAQAQQFAAERLADPAYRDACEGAARYAQVVHGQIQDLPVLDGTHLYIIWDCWHALMAVQQVRRSSHETDLLHEMVETVQEIMLTGVADEEQTDRLRDCLLAGGKSFQQRVENCTS